MLPYDLINVFIVYMCVCVIIAVSFVIVIKKMLREFKKKNTSKIV